MRGQLGLKYLTVAAAGLLVFGSALTSLAQTQSGVAASATPSSVSSPGPGTSTVPAGFPTAAPTLNAQPTATATMQPAAAAATPAPLSPIDHSAWVSTRSSGLAPGDHVLIVHSAPTAVPPAPAPGVSAGSVAAPAAPGSIPQAASRPEPRQTPGVTGASGPSWSSPAPYAQPQPVAARTPLSAVAANGVPIPAATPKLSPIDHVLVVSVHPPGQPGLIDHAGVVGGDHLSANGWTPGRALLASLRLEPGHHLTEGETLLRDTADSSTTDPRSWSVVVRKSSYLVDVLYKGRPFESYRAVFGRNPDHSAKQWEGDLRTPEGFYTIVEKYYNPRWKWFLRLSYPNYLDRVRYETMLYKGLVPFRGGRPRPLGGAIGIHGTDRPSFNRTRINWTLGCISLDNDAIDELDQLLPVGTLVIIKP
jgi:hypothetical protein